MNFFSTPPVGLDTWGLEPIDYRLNHDLHLIRRYPSPLTHFGLGNRAQKQKKVINKIKIFIKNKTIYHFLSHILWYLVYRLLPLPLLVVMVLVVHL